MPTRPPHITASRSVYSPPRYISTSTVRRSYIVPRPSNHYYYGHNYGSSRVSYYTPLTQPMPRRVYYTIGIPRPVVFRPAISIWAPAVYPVYTRPIYTTQVVSSVRYSGWDALSSEASSLRADVERARGELWLFPSVTDRALDDAANAIYDAEQLLQYGYNAASVRSTLDQARQLIEYAYTEYTAAENALMSYRDHARSQLREAEFYAENASLSSAALGSLRQATNAFERGDQAIYQNGDQALRYFEESVREADRVVEMIAATSQLVTTSPTAERYAALYDWYEQLADYIQLRPDYGTATLIDRAWRELELAQTAIRLNVDANAESAMNRAEALLDEAAAILERYAPAGG